MMGCVDLNRGLFGGGASRFYDGCFSDRIAIYLFNTAFCFCDGGTPVPHAVERCAFFF